MKNSYTAIHPPIVDNNDATNDDIISVLLIEDVPSEKDSLLQSLSQSQHGVIADLTIQTAASLTEGLEKLRAENIDVVLLDLDLPDSKSLKSVSTVRHEFPDTAIVILSGHSEEGIITEALLMGAQDFLIKGECSGIMIKHTIHQAFARNNLHKQRISANVL